MRIEEAISEYLVEIEIRGYSKKTIKTYKTKLNIFGRYCVEIEEIDDVDDIRLSTIKKYTQHMIRRGNKGTYINGSLKTLKSFIQWLNEEGYGGFNTRGGRWTWTKEKRPHIQAFTPKQVRQLLAGCQGTSYLDVRDMCIVVTFLETGIRCQELYSIKMEDIHDDYILIQGKGGKTRVVGITPVMKKYMIKYSRTRENYFELRPAEDYYFLSYTGRQMTNSAMEHMLKRRAKMVEGDDIRISPHTLRHTYAQQQLKIGNMDIYTLSRQLGHNDISITQIYLRSLSDDEVVKKAKSSSVLLNLRA